MKVPREPLIVVSCGKAKIWNRRPRAGSVPACDAYTGALFKLCRRYAEATAGERWVIFSAKYGLLSPDQPIDDYDVIITDPAAISAQALRSQWEQRFGDVNSVTSLCSRKYDQRLRAAVPAAVDIQNPLDGKNLFQRLKWLRRELCDV